MAYNKVDLHIHSNYSDSTCSPKEILDKARKIKLDVISITDHDTLAALSEVEKLDLSGVNFIPGVEMSCEAGGYSYHILAYNFNIDELQEIVNRGNKLGREKILDMSEYIKTEWQIHLTKDEINELLSKESPRKPDLGKVIVKKGFATDLEEAIHNILNKFPADKKYKLSVREVSEAIHRAGGISVWAHPLRGKGNIIFSQEEFLKRYENIKNDIDGMEIYYSLFRKKEYEFLENFSNANNLLITAGSDFHGKNKGVALGQLNKENEVIDASRITILDKLI